MTEILRGETLDLAIDTVQPHPRNPRKGNQEVLHESIERFGFYGRIIVQRSTGYILAGNHRWKELKAQGASFIPAEVVDVDDETALGILLADNRTSDLGEYDDGLLGGLLAEMYEYDGASGLLGTGYNEEDLSGLLEGLGLPDVTGLGNGEGLEDPGGVVVAPTPKMGSLAERFVVPPFSVLDARQGYWVERKKSWLTLGIDGEQGRDAPCLQDSITEESGYKGYKRMSKTSVFDPVLCELVYRWFGMPGGTVLDPFAGELTKGTVASVLGLGYTGIELRQEQVDTNNAQFSEIYERHLAPGDGGFVEIKVSAKSCRELFQGCGVDYIKSVCKGRCCDCTASDDGFAIKVLDRELPGLRSLGAEIKDGYLVGKPDGSGCKFKSEEGLCTIYNTGHRPLTCGLSPFTLNKNNTLIVKNRNRRLKCYTDKEVAKTPGYKAYRAELVRFFGEDETERLTKHLDAGGGDLVLKMSNTRYNEIRSIIDGTREKLEGDYAKFDESLLHRGGPYPNWVCGDSANLDELLPDGAMYDLIFTSPPYYDLEIYSASDKDGSAFETYEKFMDWYRNIFKQAVERLKEDRFLVIKIGDIRDNTGRYRNFLGDNIDCFIDHCGLSYVNEAVLVTQFGTLPIRAAQHFKAGRKLAKSHQNVLVFYKGDPRNVGKVFGKDILFADSGVFERDAANIERDKSND